MSRFYEHDIKAARVAYGPFDVMHGTEHKVSAWTAHIILVEAFHCLDEAAGRLVNDLISEAHHKPLNTPAWREFSTHRGHRTWRVQCVFAPFVAGSLFGIKETTQL
jgi:hypothetical protein